MPGSPTSPTAPRICSTWCAAADGPRPTTCCSSCSGRGTRSSTRWSSPSWSGRTRSTSRKWWPIWKAPRRTSGEAGGGGGGGGGRRPPGPPPPPPAAPPPPAPETKSRHIRVDLGRLDGLMDLIGELVTVRGRLNELAANARDPAIDDVAIQVSRLSRELQAEIIQARMTPVWQVFDRFPRLVRDLARELGKQVAFRVEGKEIELDRAILDELGDPLMHLLRNAVDHGIEPASERRRRGKQPEGGVVLSAARERASVAITVTDDGRGIDRAKTLERAKRDGLVDPHADPPTHRQMLPVLARPGFSTAETVPSVAGRGVGGDVGVPPLPAMGGPTGMRSE